MARPSHRSGSGVAPDNTAAPTAGVRYHHEPARAAAVASDGRLRLASAVAVFARSADDLDGHAEETARQVAVAALIGA